MTIEKTPVDGVEIELSGHQSYRDDPEQGEPQKTEGSLPLPAPLGAEERMVNAFGRRYGLSRREIEVCLATVRSTSDKSLAQKIGISTRTIQQYRSRACSKVGVRTSADLSAIIFSFACGEWDDENDDENSGNA
jgi:DNA-binding CsgD family transcriptional regulator